MNNYRNVAGNPVNKTDPSGLASVAELQTLLIPSLKSAAATSSVAYASSVIRTWLAAALSVPEGEYYVGIEGATHDQ
jgi:hypothetical protein